MYYDCWCLSFVVVLFVVVCLLSLLVVVWCLLLCVLTFVVAG